jgi:hypothetical protein
MAIRVTKEGYAFEQAAKGEWQALESKPFAVTRWDAGTQASAGAERIVFDGTGFAEPTQVVLERGGERATVEIGEDGRARLRR